MVNNIQRSASLFLVKIFFHFLLSVISLVFLFTYPLEPSPDFTDQYVYDRNTGFFSGVESNRNIIHGHFLTNVFLKALPAALTDAVAVGALVIFGRTFGVKATDISTASNDAALRLWDL